MRSTRTHRRVPSTTLFLSNILLGHYRVEFEFRYLPQDDPAALLAEVQRYAETEVAPAMHAIDTATGFAWEQIAGFPGLDLAPGAEVIELATALSGRNPHEKCALATKASTLHQSAIHDAACTRGHTHQKHKPHQI